MQNNPVWGTGHGIFISKHPTLFLFNFIHDILFVLLPSSTFSSCLFSTELR